MTQIKDVQDPPELNDSGDFVSATGVYRVMNKTLRLLLMRRGDMLHRSEIGGGLKEFANRPPTDDNLQKALNRARTTLEAISDIESFDVTIRQGEKANSLFMDLTITVGGETLSRRDIIVEG